MQSRYDSWLSREKKDIDGSHQMRPQNHDTILLLYYHGQNALLCLVLLTLPVTVTYPSKQKQNCVIFRNIDRDISARVPTGRQMRA